MSATSFSAMRPCSLTQTLRNSASRCDEALTVTTSGCAQLIEYTFRCMQIGLASLGASDVSVQLPHYAP